MKYCISIYTGEKWVHVLDTDNPNNIHAFRMAATVIGKLLDKGYTMEEIIKSTDMMYNKG